MPGSADELAKAIINSDKKEVLVDDLIVAVRQSSVPKAHVAVALMDVLAHTLAELSVEAGDTEELWQALGETATHFLADTAAHFRKEMRSRLS